MAVLLRSVFLGMKHAARVMKPQHSGVILSTASIGGLQGGLGPHVYGAAKGAVVALTRNVAAELGAWNIRVNAIAPGKILTPMNAANVVGDPDAMDEARVAFRTGRRCAAGSASPTTSPTPRCGWPATTPGSSAATPSSSTA